ncbi:hypothetical protein LPJ73_003495 [Coemansia sp. RSA 2703]|nr:hypothetical protein LPJ73_003495 [Coemansia sp. RSA 2703]KAJ2389378.1 hypothetical protein GGI05_003523 [Coemansia sp. RSA 2603]
MKLQSHSHSHGRETDRLLGSQQPTAYASTESTSSSVSPTQPIAPPLRIPLPATVPNHGSTARDFCAAERNHLSCLRLALTLMATGAAAIASPHVPRNRIPGRSHVQLCCQADFSERYGRPIGVVVFVLAAVVVVASTTVFYRTVAQLATFRRPLKWPGVLSLAVALSLAAASLAAALVRF